MVYLNNPSSSEKLTLGHSARVPSILICLALSGCSNLFNSFNSKTGINTGDIPATLSSSLPASFQITRVNQTLISPSQNLDVLGDGSGTLGSLCAVTDNRDPNATTGNSPCWCSFDFSTPTLDNSNRKTPVSYHENNLARCEYYTSIPFGVATFKVSIVVVKNGSITQNSNIATFSFSGTPALDPKLPSTYAQVKRHLCRGLVSVPNLFDSSIIDPDQSETPYYTYPLDYYTTNLASSLAYFVNSGDAANECPPVPYSSTDSDHYVNIVSSSSYGGSQIIDPPQTGTYDRSTFYVAAKATGVFAIPVNAVVAPSVISDDNGAAGVAPPLGYGAAHTSNASGGENCPSDSVIPTDYEWVKLWLFRGAVPPRNYFKSTNYFASLVCHPGDQTITNSANQTVTVPVFNACMKTYPNDNNSRTLSWSDAGKISNNYLADRVVFSKNSSNSNDSDTQCIQLNARPSGNPVQTANADSPNACTLGNPAKPGVGCGNTSGGDEWLAVVPDPTQYTSSANLGCSISTVNTGGVSRPGDDPLHICGSLTDFSRGGTHATSPSIPVSELTTEDMDNTRPRTDFIFVVSPTSISTADIKGGSKTQFTPVRGTTPDICRSGVSCQSGIGNYIGSYDLITNDINLANLSAADINQQNNPKMNLYPICVVRPKSGSNP